MITLLQFVENLSIFGEVVANNTQYSVSLFQSRCTCFRYYYATILWEVALRVTSCLSVRVSRATVTRIRRKENHTMKENHCDFDIQDCLACFVIKAPKSICYIHYRVFQKM